MNAARLAATGLGWAAAALILALTAVTLLDVVGRYALDAPLAGAFELTETLVAALVFAALPLTTRNRGHVAVDLVGGRLARPLDRIGGGLVAIALMAMAWRLGAQALRLGEDGSMTTELSLPLAPLGWFCAASCALAALCALIAPPAQTQLD